MNLSPIAADPSQADMTALAILNRLRDMLGASTVLLGTDIPARNCNDWSTQPPQTPIAVIRPVDAAGVSAALKACAEAKLSVVPQGGLTGLCGGARPEPGWVALSLERMVGVEEIDEASATMTVRAGTPLEAVQRAADEAGFFFALDLGARGSCAIGGNLSTNAGGNRVIRYGMAREMVLGLEVVLPDGTIVTSLNKMLKNNAGYDLKQLFIGSEGTLGIITRIVLRLFPKPGCTMAALCAVPDYAAVVTLLGETRRGLGPLLSAFEVMWPDYWKVVTERVGVRSPVAGQHGLYVLIEAQGTEEAIDAPRFEAWMERLMDKGLRPADAAVSRSVADTQSFWALRDACAEFFQVLGPHISYDIGLPVREMDVYARRCKAALQAFIPGCESVHYGHIGDGNMHLVVWVPGLGLEQQPKEAMDEVIYGLVKEFGGTVSAEHGIGTAKKRWLGHARSPEEIALMHTLKAAIDPTGLLNPRESAVKLTWVFKGIEALLAFLLLGMVVMVFGNVVLRYAFNSGIDVSEELSRIFFVWLTFIGAIVAMHDGTHLGMDNVVSKLSRNGKLVCLTLTQLMILLCCAMLFWGTWRQHEINATNRAPVTGMSMIWVFGVGYLTSAAIAVHAIHKLWRIATRKITDGELIAISESEEVTK